MVRSCVVGGSGQRAHGSDAMRRGVDIFQKARELERRVFLLLMLALLGGFFAASVQDARAASESDTRLVGIGLKVFRATLAADSNLGQKLDRQRHLEILFFYRTDRAAAAGYARKLIEPGGLLDYELRAVLSDDAALRDYSASPPAAIFIAESRLPLTDLQSLRAFCERHSCLLFSPFEADVERGVATGLFVGARVLPYVNAEALQASGVRLQAFFLAIAKTTD